MGLRAELSLLTHLLERVVSGERQIAFVTGEAGAGKSVLVNTFVEAARANGSFWIAYGHCHAQNERAEPYLPILNALADLHGQIGKERLASLLMRFAPTWLQQMPALGDPATMVRPPRDSTDATRKGMMREIAEALEALSDEVPLALVLDDLHYCDEATLDLISYLAQRRMPAKLMVLGLYRIEDAIQSASGVRMVMHALLLRRRCTEVALRPFGRAELEEYLARCHPLSVWPAELTALLQRRGGGNPLFTISLIESLIIAGATPMDDQGRTLDAVLLAAEEIVPETIRILVEARAERLKQAERRILEAASAAGHDFSAEEIGLVLEMLTEQVEEHLEELVALRRFIERSEAGTATRVARRYRFIHPLYRDVFLLRMGTARRIRYQTKLAENREPKSSSA